MSRWNNAEESYLGRVVKPDIIWLEYFTFHTSFPYETLIAIILEELDDSFIIAYPAIPIVEIRTHDDPLTKNTICASAEVANLAPVLRVYKASILYSNDPPKELKLAYYSLLKTEDISALPEMLRQSPGHPNFGMTDNETIITISDECDRLDLDCKLKPDIFDDEGTQRIFNMAGVDYEEEQPDGHTIH